MSALCGLLLNCCWVSQSTHGPCSWLNVAQAY